jgi:hypothetical protein
MTDNLPMNWQEQMAKEAKAVSRAFRPSTAQISTKSGMMSYMGQAIPGNKLDVIVLAAIFENNLFEGKFDPRNPRNPICFAFGKPESDGKKPEMVPHPAIEKPHDKRCDLCEYSQWGSDTESMSGKGKRCKEIYKLGLIPKGQDSSDEMAILRIPLTSRKNWDVYVNAIAAQGRPSWGVLTTISLHPHQRNQFEVKFELKEMLDETTLAKVYPKISGAFEALMEPYDPNQNPLERKEPVAANTKKKY